jgi:hypothetical protein
MIFQNENCMRGDANSSRVFQFWTTVSGWGRCASKQVVGTTGAADIAKYNAAIQIRIESSEATRGIDWRAPDSQEGSNPVCLSFR